MIDSRTVGDDGTPAQLIRYQFGNHLGTALLELDDAAKIISYEEYYPYGSTSFQSVDASREVPARRYRYTGKERDEESGLYYHGARYYAPWLGRWTAADPSIWTNNKLNAFLYALASPLTFFDPDGKDEQTAATGVTFRFDFSPSPTITKPQAGIVWLGSGQPPDVARGLPNFGIGGSSSTASSTGSGGQTGWLAAGGLAAGGLPPGLQPPGPFSFPSSPGSPVQVPGFGPESFKYPFIEPTPSSPVTLPSSPTVPVSEPPPATGLIGEILGVVGEVLTGAAVIVTAGIFVPSDTSLDKSSRNLRVKLIESLQQYVNQENDVLSDAIKRGDFSLIEEKAPKLLEAILNIANSDPEKAVGLFKIAYGQTVEALVADLISNDPLLSQYLEKLGGANKEDFRGIGLLQDSFST